MTAETPILHPGVNAEAICDCGARMWRVGVEVSTQYAGMIGHTANHIRCIQCVKCGHKLAVPFTTAGGAEVHAMKPNLAPTLNAWQLIASLPDGLEVDAWLVDDEGWGERITDITYLGEGRWRDSAGNYWSEADGTFTHWMPTPKGPAL